jgi:rare lipoprotein A
LLFSVADGFGQERGIASYYSDVFNGRKMANGARYDPEQFTCAHPTAPLGSIMKVARKDDHDKTVMVIVTDRGPFIKGRIIDLSKSAARELGILDHGIMDVVVALVKVPVEY